MAKVRVDSLHGVSETTLWTLHNRASEAKRHDSLIVDPVAVRAFEAIDYEYCKFGAPTLYHPLRALAFDAQVRKFLTEHPRASVVAVAEGLQTSFWRVDNGGVTWYSIDLPAVIELRKRLLPTSDRIVPLAQSALDVTWISKVDRTNRVFITVEGLMMYLEPEEVLRLIQACAQGFPGGRMIFDNHPPWLGRRAKHGLRLSPRYTTPPMPFSLSEEERTALSTIPGVSATHDINLPAGRGIWSVIDTHRSGIPMRPTITLLEFSG